MKNTPNSPKRGRPTKYNSNMDHIIIAAGKQGLSKEAICGLLDITYDTMWRWMNKDSPTYQKSFSDAIQAAHAYSRLYYEELMNSKILNANGDLNNHAAALIMRNIHKWDSKQTVQHEGSDGGPIQHTFRWGMPEDKDDE